MTGAPPPDPASAAPVRRRVAVITGSRAEFGLLTPVMRGVRDHPALELIVIAAGSHLISPAETYRDVKRLFSVADAVPMQVAGRTGRLEDAEALGLGVQRFVRAFRRQQPSWVVVLGDRIEAFAAACAASVGGLALAHLHGGDRAEGIADEAMRHAISKLAHLHLPATHTSAQRLLRMGERPDSVHVIGSPAIDGLDAIPPLDAARFAELGSPDTLLLLHPVGRSDEHEELVASRVLGGLRGRRVLALHPNHDPGREGVLRALDAVAGLPVRTHLPREVFVGLLRRLAGDPGAVMVGNSSAGLIEAAALRLPVVDVGPRQGGRERAGNAVHAEEREEDVARAVRAALSIERSTLTHPFGDGRAGPRAAELLARTDPHRADLLRKRHTD